MFIPASWKNAPFLVNSQDWIFSFEPWKPRTNLETNIGFIKKPTGFPLGSCVGCCPHFVRFLCGRLSPFLPTYSTGAKLRSVKLIERYKGVTASFFPMRRKLAFRKQNKGRFPFQGTHQGLNAPRHAEGFPCVPGA